MLGILVSRPLAAATIWMNKARRATNLINDATWGGCQGMWGASVVNQVNIIEAFASSHRRNAGIMRGVMNDARNGSRRMLV